MLSTALVAVVLTAPPANVEVTQVVPAAPDKVWAALTTAEGVKTFFAPDAKVELKPGGAYEMYFMPDRPEGERGGEGCTVVSFEPNQKLVFTWNFPPSIPALRKSKAKTEVAVTLAPEGTGTRVTLVQSGWKDGADWKKGREYFAGAWKTVLARLERRFRRGPLDVKLFWRPVELASLKWLEGTWSDGGSNEEQWRWTSQGLFGSYRALKDGKPSFYEVVTIEPEGPETVLLMRMFGRGLGAFAITEKAPLRFLLESSDESTATFITDDAEKTQLIYTRKKDKLDVVLDRGAKGKETFAYARVKSP
jgi:uncharacterized protein YndB with AHSA1/START domain